MKVLWLILLVPALASAQMIGRSPFYTVQGTVVAPTVENFKVGEYTGSGVDNRSITGVGFKPDVVIIKAVASAYGVWKTSVMVGTDSSQRLAGGGWRYPDMIQSLDADGFTIGTDAKVNTDAVVYQWMVWKQEAGYMKVGTFYMPSTTPVVVTGVGFQPDLVIWSGRKEYSNSFWKTSSMGTDTSLQWGDSPITANISTFAADGFTALYDENSVEDSCYYAAFKIRTDYTWVGRYVGNATDDRDITGATAQPNLVLAGGAGSRIKVFYSSTDECFGMWSWAHSQTAIKALNATGFRVSDGNVVNENAIETFWIAWKER